MKGLYRFQSFSSNNVYNRPENKAGDSEILSVGKRAADCYSANISPEKFQIKTDNGI